MPDNTPKISAADFKKMGRGKKGIPEKSGGIGGSRNAERLRTGRGRFSVSGVSRRLDPDVLLKVCRAVDEDGADIQYLELVITNHSTHSHEGLLDYYLRRATDTPAPDTEGLTIDDL